MSKKTFSLATNRIIKRIISNVKHRVLTIYRFHIYFTFSEGTEPEGIHWMPSGSILTESWLHQTAVPVYGSDDVIGHHQEYKTYQAL